MFVLEYLLYLGIAWVVFSLVNWLFGLVAALVLTLTRFGKGFYITTVFSGYILVSLTALLTLGAISVHASAASTVLLPILGGTIVFMAMGQGAYSREKAALEAAREDYDYTLLERVRYDGFFVIGLTVLYVVMLFVPFIAENPLTMRLLALIDWAYNLKIVGWILRIGGVLFMLAFVAQGFFYSMALMGSVIGAFRKGEEGVNWFQRHLNWTWVFAYLIWIPLNAVDSIVPQIIGAVLLLFVSGWVIKQKGRRLWWMLLTPVFSPLWLNNKKRVPDLTDPEIPQ